MRIFALMRGKSDTEIAMICQWDNQAIELLYDRYYRALVSYGCQFVENEVAEDIVQELFSVLWERRPLFSSISQFSTYLYNTVHNSALNHLRHQTVHNNYRQSIIEHLQEFMLVDDISDIFNKEEIYRQLFAAIDELPPRQKEVFLLCMEGKKNKEIAEQLDISAETVKVQKRRAIAQLRGKLSPMLIGIVFVLIRKTL